MSPNGKQYNGIELATNDSRVLGGIIDKDWIQFVQHSMDTNYGTAGIYHGIIYNYDVNPYVESRIISDSIIDFGYPNIASTGINPNENTILILFVLYSLIRTGPFRFFRITFNDPFLVYYLIFSLFFAFSVEIAGTNFGGLLRYKIPLMPFFFSFI